MGRIECEIKIDPNDWPFLQVPTALALDERISDGAVRTYTVLLYWGRTNKQVWTRRRKMAEVRGVGRSTFRKHLAELEDPAKHGSKVKKLSKESKSELDCRLVSHGVDPSPGLGWIQRSERIMSGGAGTEDYVRHEITVFGALRPSVMRSKTSVGGARKRAGGRSISSTGTLDSEHYISRHQETDTNRKRNHKKLFSGIAAQPEFQRAIQPEDYDCDWDSEVGDPSPALITSDGWKTPTVLSRKRPAAPPPRDLVSGQVDQDHLFGVNGRTRFHGHKDAAAGFNEDVEEVWSSFNRALKDRWPGVVIPRRMSAKTAGQIKNSLLRSYNPLDLDLMSKLIVWDWEAIQNSWRSAYKTGVRPTLDNLVSMSADLANALDSGVTDQQNRVSMFKKKYIAVSTAQEDFNWDS